MGHEVTNKVQSNPTIAEIEAMERSNNFAVKLQAQNLAHTTRVNELQLDHDKALHAAKAAHQATWNVIQESHVRNISEICKEYKVGVYQTEAFTLQFDDNAYLDEESTTEQADPSPVSGEPN